MPSVPPPLRAAEREQLIADVTWAFSHTNALDKVRDNDRRIAIEVIADWLCEAGYAKPSLPPDGSEAEKR